MLLHAQTTSGGPPPSGDELPGAIAVVGTVLAGGADGGLLLRCRGVVNRRNSESPGTGNDLPHGKHARRMVPVHARHPLGDGSRRIGNQGHGRHELHGEGWSPRYKHTYIHTYIHTHIRIDSSSHQAKDGSEKGELHWQSVGVCEEVIYIYIINHM